MPEELAGRRVEKSYEPLNVAKGVCVQEPRHVMLHVETPTVRNALTAQALVRLGLSAEVGGCPCAPSFGGRHDPRGPTI